MAIKHKEESPKLFAALEKWGLDLEFLTATDLEEHVVESLIVAREELEEALDDLEETEDDENYFLDEEQIAVLSVLLKRFVRKSAITHLLFTEIAESCGESVTDLYATALGVVTSIHELAKG